MKNKGKKKVKVIYVDSGRTVYDMDGVTRQNAFLPQGLAKDSKDKKDKKEEKERVGLNRKEKFAAIRAALSVYAVPFVCVIGCFTIVAVLLYFWLV